MLSSSKIRTKNVTWVFFILLLVHIRDLLYKTLTGEKNLVKSENFGKHNFTIDFTIGKKFWLK